MEVFTERRLASDGEKQSVAALLSVGRMPQIPSLHTENTRNLHAGSHAKFVLLPGESWCFCTSVMS